MLSLKTNIQAINAHRSLNQSTLENNKANEKLSSGLRINRAADDAAGLAMSEKMRAEIRGLIAAKANSDNGVSLIQTAEGGLNEISNILIRLRELAIQASSDTIGNTERAFLQKEFAQMKDEIDRIASVSEYNGTPLLAGDGSQISEEREANYNTYPLEFQVGARYFGDRDGLDIEQPQNIIRVDLQNFNAMTSGENSLNIGKSSDEDGTRIDSKQEAQITIAKMDKAIEKVSDFRAYLGAVQNRLESTSRNLSVTIENMAASESRIRDTDIGLVTAEAARTNILKQAGTAVLAQANLSPQTALNLLR